MGTSGDVRTAEERARSWYRVAKLTAVLLLVGTPGYFFVALTFGLISGLVVLMAPLYPVLFQAAVTTIFVSVCLGKRWWWGARIAGALLTLAPAIGATAWYAREWMRCEAATDSAACFAYLNGSPLLPIGVTAYGIFSLLATAAVLLVVRAEARHG